MNETSTPDAGAEPEGSGYDAGPQQDDGQAEPVDVGEAFARHGLDADHVPASGDEYELASTGHPQIDQMLEAGLNGQDGGKMQWFQAKAAALGLSQRQFNEIATEYAAGMLSQMPDTDAEIAQLGPRGEERLSAVEQWAQSNLPPDAQAWLAEQPVTAGMVSFLEAVADSAGSPLTYGEGNDEQVAAVHKAEIKRLQATPEYRRGDKATVARVRRAYSALARQRAQGKHP
jgi:hypothetical protein